MIWIASFPRSGNTFVRNILYEVYGLSSSEFHREADYHLDKEYFKHPFVKTHLHPGKLEPDDPNIKSVYLVRDGRDAMVSIAHQRSDIVAPGSDFIENLKAAIFAEKDTFFGGWSKNVNSWLEKADLILRYEDLLADPINQIERLRAIIDLPEPDPSKIPSFEQLKSGNAAYGARKSWGYSDNESKQLADKAFRKGTSKSWKTEMPDELHDLFWTYHGPTMEKLGYTMEGDLALPDPELEHIISRKLGIPQAPKTSKKYQVLIEANKMDTRDNDGVKRYVAGLIDGMIPLTSNENGKWHIDLLINNDIIPLKDYAHEMEKSFNAETKSGNGQAKPIVHKKSLFERLEAFMRGLVPDSWIKWLVDNKILIFHKTYDFIKKAIFGVIFWIQQAILFVLRMLYTFYLSYKQHRELKAISERISHYDLIHVPLQQHYWPFKYTNVPLAFTIHDFTHVLFPKFHTGINIKNAENGLKMITKKQSHVIAVSRSTFNDSKKFLTLPESNFHLVYEATEEEKFLYQVNKDDSGKVRKKYGIPKLTPFILLLSTIEPRKNLINSINAFQLLHKKHPELDLHLVVSGKQGWKMKKVVGYTTKIFFTGFVDDKDLSALFSESMALSYVSFYEGFGLPLLEAMRCGTPVIYGDNSSMPEVAGDGGLAANADSVEDIADKYEQLFFNKELREELSMKAMKQSLKFSSRKSTLEMLQTYEKIIKSS